MPAHGIAWPWYPYKSARLGSSQSRIGRGRTGRSDGPRYGVLSVAERTARDARGAAIRCVAPGPGPVPAGLDAGRAGMRYGAVM